MKLRPPHPVLEIASALEAAGFDTWCVGGAIRDALLGHPHLDWDLATSATPEQVRDVFGHRRTIPVGIDFGTVGVLDRHGKMHEVTTFRRDVKTDGRHAEVEFGVSLDDDLARRDFTINAIAYSPSLDEIRDPFEGQRDLTNRLVRAVGDPDARMREDRLRALRAIRFAARFGFTIEPATRAAIEASAPFLGRLSRERVKQELDKTMEQVRCPSLALETWRATGAFRSLVPQLDDCPIESFVTPDYLAMPGPKTRPARRGLRFAGLMAGLTPRDAVAALTDLRASRAEIQLVSTVLERWRLVREGLTTALMSGVAPTDGQIREWVSQIGRLQIGHVMRLAAGVWAAGRARKLTVPSTESIGAVYRRMLTSALRDPIDLASLAVDGGDLRRAGIPAGPGLGRILNALLASVIVDPARNTTDWLLQEAQRLEGERGAESSPSAGHIDRR